MTLRVLSLGAGVQSTTMALMAAHGEIGPMPHCAIFADTGAEPKAVYEHLAWLTSDGLLPFPIVIVQNGNIKDDLIGGVNSTANKFASIPFFTLHKGKAGMARRQCTKEYKLQPILKQVRRLLGGKTPKGGAEMWIGISTDEALRMKPSRVQYIVNRWPLIEKGINRAACLAWLERNGYARPPKSACTFCPYRSDESWRAMKDGDPVSFAEAVSIDNAIRSNGTALRMNAELYLHRSLKPLDQVDLRTHAEVGQPDLFNNECEGMCGV
jgi:hypothetical protein